ncbi:MAD2L1-binding protein isoform X2 [Frieseomelitta varia]|uniref:MAD2L1-binding protein isoform X2 n=1 Tax=Frieseomelitta varia TaxID=561572 RepID=UPI001CB6B22D|nr:MAD2L1-binding protein isoform X2 [Frieseomelitta varia]
MNINVALDEHLTSNSCVKLVIELLKYILYQKQQIPFTCDSLSQLKMKPTDRNLSSIRTLLSSLKSTSEQLNSQFHQKHCKIKEIAILIGATIISPKLHIRIEFPSDILNSQEHFECKHASRKPLLSLMRSILECPEFQAALSLPLSPTNTFVLIQKSDDNLVSEFFLPKPQYIPSNQSSNYFVIKLQHNDQVRLNCNCMNLVKVYNEVSESDTTRSKDTEFLNKSNHCVENYSSFNS